MLDVGGTLVPDLPPGWRDPKRIDELCAARLLAALPQLTAEATHQLVARLRLATAEMADALVQDNRALVRQAVDGQGLRLDQTAIAAVADAMCLPFHGRAELFPGARELLASLKKSGLACVLVSNTIWRTNPHYWRDFKDLGVDRDIDAIVTSADLGFRKPHPAIFEAALRPASCDTRRSIMIGNSEEKDIAPALALGLRTIRVAIEEPRPATSAANVVVTSLSDAAVELRKFTAAH